MTVMQSFRNPRPTTNPYITMLDRALADELGSGHLRFSWLRALFGRYDVFHWHWPEAKVTGTSWWKSVGKHLLVAAIVVRHRFGRVAVVRTVHNVHLPEVAAPTRVLLRLVERWTDHRIVLNPFTIDSSSGQLTLIPHGDYRPWYGPLRAATDATPWRVGAFGAIRRYKGIDTLLPAYADAVASDERLSLVVAGRPSTEELRDQIVQQVGSLPNAQIIPDYLDDPEFVRLLTSCSLVVLAYRFMHNSGSVLAALSLGRPVLVPRNEVNEALADEVGETWVHLYDEDISGADVLKALQASGGLPPPGCPDLSERSWDTAGPQHRLAYEAAAAEKRGRRALP